MNPVFCFGEYELDSDALELRYAGVPVHVDTTVLRVLETLVRNPGKVVSKEELLATVWGGRAVSDNSLTVAMTRLRKALDEHGSRDCVLTVHGQGYRFAHPVAVREPDAPAVFPLPPRHPTLAGREQVMQQLGRALSELKSGCGGLIALRGEPGIGKTRVAEVFDEQAARAGCAVSWAFCRELSDAPAFWPFVELLRSMIHKASAGASNGHSVASLLPELSVLLPELNADYQPRPFDSRHQVYDLVARTLACVAEATPQVLILDDVHCADPASLDLLYYLLAGISRMRVLIVVTLCHVPHAEPSAPRLTAVLSHRNCLRVALAPLSKTAVLGLVAARGIRDPALSQKLYSLSEGNPFYLGELLRQLRDEHNSDGVGLTLPPVVSELMRRRLAGMSSEACDVLRFAAVIGKTFGLPLLAAATERTPAALMPSLDSACTSEIIRCVGQSGTHFEFTHNLLRSVLYEQQTPGARRARHLRVVEALERRRAMAEVACSELADHALAALPDGDLHKTVELCAQAASRAEEQGAFPSAIRYLKYARASLDLLDGNNAQLRFQLLFRHALLVRAHSARDFLPLAEELLRLGREQSAAALAAASLLLDPFPGFPRLPIVRGALGEALSHLDDEAPSLRPALLARLASSVPLAYSAEAAYAQIERALHLAASSPERGDRFGAHFGELYLYGGPAHRARSATALRALDSLCNEAVPIGPMPATLLDLHRALTALQAGDMPHAERAFERWELRLRDADADGEMLWHLARLRALAQINLGHATQGRAALLALHRRSQCCVRSSGTALFCAYDQSVLLAPGELDVVPSLMLAPDGYDPPNIWALKVRALAALGSPNEARSALELVPAERLPQLPCDREYLGTMGALARAALSLQAHEYLRSIYQCLKPFPEFFAVNLSGYCEGSVSLLLGLLARGIAETKAATKHFEVAVELSERAGLLRSAAEAKLELNLCRPSN